MFQTNVMLPSSGMERCCVPPTWWHTVKMPHNAKPRRPPDTFKLQWKPQILEIKSHHHHCCCRVVLKITTDICARSLVVWIPAIKGKYIQIQLTGYLLDLLLGYKFCYILKEGYRSCCWLVQTISSYELRVHYWVIPPQVNKFWKNTVSQNTAQLCTHKL